MQFICEDPVHVVVRSEVPALYDLRGRMTAPKQRRVYAKFSRGHAPGYGVDLARTLYKFAKKPDEVHVEHWVAYYDSVEDQAVKGWTDEERKAIEEKLLAQGYVLLERPRVAAPYPMYDEHRRVRGVRKVEHAIKDIVASYELAGFDINQAIAYERENGNSEEVVAALEALRAPREAEGLSLIEA